MSSEFELFISPEPAPRMTKKQVRLAKVPDWKLTKEQLTVKNRIVRYLTYKDSLQWIAKQANFSIPKCDFHVMFFIPTKVKGRHLKPHQIRPDTDNYMKAFKDALAKKDESIWDYRVSKYWIEAPKGMILIRPINPIQL